MYFFPYVPILHPGGEGGGGGGHNFFSLNAKQMALGTAGPLRSWPFPGTGASVGYPHTN